MTRPLLFPGLGLEFHISRVAFSIGPLTVYWYGIILVFGMGMALLYCTRRSRDFGIHPDRVSDVILYAIVAGLIGARIYYVLFSWDYYSQHPAEIFRIWEGGIAIYGGILGGLLGSVLLCKLWKIPLLPLLDLMVGGLILGQAIGRWGNFMNIEAFGGNTTLPWGMTGPSIVAYLEGQAAVLAEIGVIVDPIMPVHPTFFYESLWNLAGFGFIVWYTSRRRLNGELTLLYLAWYGLGRAWIEGLRTDSLMWGSVRVSQLLAAVCAVASALLLWQLRKRFEAGRLAGIFAIPPLGERHAAAEAMLPKQKQQEASPSVEETVEETVENAEQFADIALETAEKPLDKED